MDFKHINILVLIFFISVCPARDPFDAELLSNRTKIKAIKQEILALQEKLDNSKRQETSTSGHIALLDEEIALISRTKGLLEQQKRILQKRISQTDNRLKDTRKRLESLEDLYAQRVIYAYKYGRLKNIELILTASSLNQALTRFKYLKVIAEHDERVIKNIIEKKKEIEALKINLQKDLLTHENTIKAKKDEEKIYKNRKNEKHRILKKLQKDQSFYQKQIIIKEEEQEQLTAMIIALERKRRLREEMGVEMIEPEYDFKDFQSAQGKLIWPVTGNIITRYGKQRDPVSKTTINNTDIEIKSTLGTPVKNIFDGAVRMITYLSSYGNTVIIDHGKGFYTVYSHLDEIYVNKGDFVRTGEVIATVGDSGSLGGARLQFGIYGEKKTYNPEKWLKGS